MSPRPGTQLQKRRKKRGEKKGGKKARRNTEHEGENNICISVFYLASPHTHKRGFLMSERLRKYGQVRASGSTAGNDKRHLEKAKSLGVFTRRGQDAREKEKGRRGEDSGAF